MNRYLLLLAVCLSGPVLAWNYTFETVPVTEASQRVTVLDAQRLLTSHSNGTGLVIDRDFQPLDSFFVAPLRLGSLRSQSVIADGGFSILHRLATSDLLRRFDPAFTLRWSEQVPGITNSSGIAHVHDSADNLWLTSGTRLLRFSVDGVLRLNLALPRDTLKGITAIMGDPDGAGVYVAARFGLTSGLPTDSGAASFAADGSLRWIWVDPVADSGYERIMPNAHGDVSLLGRGPLGTPSVVVLDPQGQLLWRFTGLTNVNTQIAAFPDGAVLIHESIGFLPEKSVLRLLDADGHERWRQARDAPAGHRLSDVRVLVHPDAGIVVAEELFSAESGVWTRVERVDLQGRSLWVQEVRTTLGFDTPEFDLSALQGNGSVLARLNNEDIRFAAADGARSRISVTTPLLDTAAPLASDLAANGQFAVAIQHRQTSALNLLGADGGLRWREETRNQPFIGLSVAQPDRVCGVQLQNDGALFSCRKASDGSVLWSTRAFTPEGTRALAFRGLADGRLLLLLQYGSPNLAGIQWLMTDAAGQLVQRELALGEAASARFALGGESVVLTSGLGPALLRVGPDGAIRFRLPLASLGNVLDAAPLVTGDTLLRLSTAQASELALVNAAGQRRWSQALVNPQADQIEVLEAGETLFVAGYEKPQTAAPASPTQTEVLALKRADGALLWRVQVPSLDGRTAGKRLALDASGQRLALGRALRHAYELQLLDSNNGQSLGQRLLDLSEGQSVLEAKLGGDGQLRLLSRVEGDNAAIQLRVDASAGNFTGTASPIELLGRVGAWYDPASSGQGWLLDILPASRTVYAAWFTYSAGAGNLMNLPGRLRWYSLQGSYAPGASEVELDVLENSGGVFASPPITAARKIGTAKLRFEGCGSALLEYQFTEENLPEQRNRVAIRALAIRDPQCRNPSPAVVAQGFSSAASGAWFDPVTAGQGLVSVVQPPEAGAGAGLFFAGWFHYDPAGKSDDPRQQAWLSLQGSLQSGVDGKVEVGIFRTLGGQLGGPSTRNTTRIGSAEIRLQGCERMRLDYRFDAGELSAPYAGITGSQQLLKLGGCAP